MFQLGRFDPKSFADDVYSTIRRSDRLGNETFVGSHFFVRELAGDNFPSFLIEGHLRIDTRIIVSCDMRGLMESI